MAGKLRPSEFGGTTQRNGIAPPLTPLGHTGHTNLTPEELLKLTYRTGQTEDTTRDPDSGETMAGILPLDEQTALMPDVKKWIEENG